MFGRLQVPSASNIAEGLGQRVSSLGQGVGTTLRQTRNAVGKAARNAAKRTRNVVGRTRSYARNTASRIIGRPVPVAPEPVSPVSVEPVSVGEPQNVPLPVSRSENPKLIDIYSKILEGMFLQPPGPSDYVPKKYRKLFETDKKRIPLYYPVKRPIGTTEEYILMKDFNKPLERGYETYDEKVPSLKIVPSLLECQIMSGFKVEPQLIQEGKNGHPKQIFKRLGVIAQQNLVAFSEGGSVLKNQKDYNNVMIESLQAQFDDVTKSFDDVTKSLRGDIEQDGNIYFNDTGFIFKDFNNNDKVVYVSSSLKMIYTHGLNILNVHFGSSGPKPLEGETTKESIHNWCDKNLPNISSLATIEGKIDKIPDIICGDTNITISKSKTKGETLDRKKLMEYICGAINAKYNLGQEQGQAWGILMNPTIIKKIRTGGFLLNQQINKSNVIENEEADGTMIAFRYLLSNPPSYEIINNYVGSHWECCIGEQYMTSMPEPEHVNFLDFKYDLDRCIDQNGKLLDPLFIDHAPVQLSLEGIKALAGIAETSETDDTPWKNLVVLNLGSIINDSKKWNIDLIPRIEDITRIDKDLFNAVYDALKVTIEGKQELILSGCTEPYDCFQGNKFGDFKLYNVPEMLNPIATAMAEAHLSLHRAGIIKDLNIESGQITGGYKKVKNKMKKTNKKKRKYSKKYGKSKRKQYKY